MAKACFHFMRVILVIISLLFMLLGLAIVALALFVKLAAPMDDSFKNNASGQAVNISLYILIGLGAFMAIFGFVGCFGACRKSTVCLSIYITILLIIILGEIGLGVFLVIQTSALTSKADTVIDNMVKDLKKRNNADKKTMLSWIQIKLECCGGAGPKDYDNGDPPKSCCLTSKDKEDSIQRCQRLVAEKRGGCKTAYKKYFTSTGFPILIGVILGIAVIEFIGIAFAIAICCHSRRHDAGYVSVVT